MKKTTQLKQMILNPQLEFLMEAHSGMSAKVVEEARFKRENIDLPNLNIIVNDDFSLAGEFWDYTWNNSNMI